MLAAATDAAWAAAMGGSDGQPTASLRGGEGGEAQAGRVEMVVAAAGVAQRDGVEAVDCRNAVEL